MKISPKIYIAGAVLTLIAAAPFVTSLWSDHKIRVLEGEIESAKTMADQKTSVAEELEKQAGEYKAKNEYLEQKIAEMNAIAKKQDEELETLSKNTDTAHGDVDRARRVRSVAATADQLCAKLADLGHACE